MNALENIIVTCSTPAAVDVMDAGTNKKIQNSAAAMIGPLSLTQFINCRQRKSQQIALTKNGDNEKKSTNCARGMFCEKLSTETNRTHMEAAERKLRMLP